MALGSAHETDRTGNTTTRVTIGLRNISNSDKHVVGPGPNAIHLFYVADNGSTVRLADPANHKSSGNSLDDLLDYQSHGSHDYDSIGIPGGDTHPTSMSFELTADEALLVKTHPVYCKFAVRDVITQQKYNIQTTPKLLKNGP